MTDPLAFYLIFPLALAGIWVVLNNKPSISKTKQDPPSGTTSTMALQVSEKSANTRLDPRGELLLAAAAGTNPHLRDDKQFRENLLNPKNEKGNPMAFVYSEKVFVPK